MEQVEGIRATVEDCRELERKIKELENEIIKSNSEWKPSMAPEIPKKIKELRRLRRLRK